jgi:hypothetical protein
VTVAPVGWKNHFTGDEYRVLRWYDGLLKQDDYVLGRRSSRWNPGQGLDVAPIVDPLMTYAGSGREGPWTCRCAGFRSCRSRRSWPSEQPQQPGPPTTTVDEAASGVPPPEPRERRGGARARREHGRDHVALGWATGQRDRRQPTRLSAFACGGYAERRTPARTSAGTWPGREPRLPVCDPPLLGLGPARSDGAGRRRVVRGDPGLSTAATAPARTTLATLSDR